MVERAEELREQLDMQRADISRTVEQIENRVVPGRVLSRRKYRMRRSFMDIRDRVMGNDQPEYPSHWYAQPAAPLGPGYGEDTRYSYGGGYGADQGGGRLEGARERAGEMTGRASQTVHGMGDRASESMHGMGDRASESMHGMGERASGAVHGMSDRMSDAPQMMRRQTQGSPMAMGLVAFGAGVLAAALLPETEKEKQLARQAEPRLQHAVEGARELGSEMAQEFKEPVQESVEQVKSTATSEAQGLKEEATQEAQATKAEVRSTVKE